MNWLEVPEKLEEDDALLDPDCDAEADRLRDRVSDDDMLADIVDVKDNVLV